MKKEKVYISGPITGLERHVYLNIFADAELIGFELKDSYFAEAVKNARQMEAQSEQKTFFD